MLALGFSLLLVSVEGEASTDSGWRYDRYVTSTDCGDRKPLSEKEKTGLTMAGDVFRILTVVGTEEQGNETAEWMVMGVDGSPMDEAGNFPDGRCASEVALSTADGESYKGIAEFRDVSTDGEHRGYAIRVLFEEESPVSEIRYNNLGYRIDGHLKPKSSDKTTRPFAGWSVIIEQWN